MKRFWTIALASIMALVIAAGLVYAGFFYERQIGGTVTVVPVGEISVSPSTFTWGDVNRGDVITESITVTNLSDGPMEITADSTIEATLSGYSTTFTLCSVDWSGIDTTLAKSGDPGDSVTADVIFTIDDDAMAGAASFDFVVTGTTPTS